MMSRKIHVGKEDDHIIQGISPDAILNHLLFLHRCLPLITTSPLSSNTFCFTSFSYLLFGPYSYLDSQSLHISSWKHQQKAPNSLVVKSPHANAGDIRDSGLIPGSGRSPGGSHGDSLQYSCLENPMDRRAWWATVHGHHQMVNTEIRLIIFFAAKDGEALYSQQKQDQEKTTLQTTSDSDEYYNNECLMIYFPTSHISKTVCCSTCSSC